MVLKVLEIKKAIILYVQGNVLPGPELEGTALNKIPGWTK